MFDDFQASLEENVLWRGAVAGMIGLNLLKMSKFFLVLKSLKLVELVKVCEKVEMAVVDNIVEPFEVC